MPRDVGASSRPAPGSRGSSLPYDMCGVAPGSRLPTVERGSRLLVSHRSRLPVGRPVEPEPATRDGAVDGEPAPACRCFLGASHGAWGCGWSSRERGRNRT